MSILKKIKYPKFLTLILIFILTYILFSGKSFEVFHSFIVSLGYVGAFISGLLFVFGFTAPIATAILLVLSSNLNIFIAGFLAGFGALLGDLIIFKFIRLSFKEEIDFFRNEKIYLKLKSFIPESIRKHKYVKYFMIGFAGLFIAAPLPDEIGISIIAMFRNISELTFILLSFVLNTIGIFIVLGIGSLI